MALPPLTTTMYNLGRRFPVLGRMLGISRERAPGWSWRANYILQVKADVVPN